MTDRQSNPDTARASAIAGELRAVLGKLKRRLRGEMDPGEFTWSQLSVLSHLEQFGPATVTTLARAEGVRPQSMGATVAGLEAAGMVTGAPDPADGRQTILSLTAACLDMIRAGRAARDDWMSHAIQTKLTPDEREDLAAAIALLKRLVDS